MNIFGLFFSFFIPGMVVGMMAMAAIYHSAKEKRHAATRRFKKGPNSSKQLSLNNIVND